MADMNVVGSELILGGQKSGRSARAESLAAAWLAQSSAHRAVFIATAQPWDEEMRERIARHQSDRAERLPGMSTVEEPLRLAEAIKQHSRADTLLVVDCLTLWLTNWLMPVAERVKPSGEGEDSGLGFKQKPSPALDAGARAAMVSGAVRQAGGPVVLVSNEIGLGVIPLGREVRAFVDALGRLNQDMARVCERVTLMAAGLPLTLKGEA